MAGGCTPYLRAIPAMALWDKATEEFITASPLTIPGPHVVEALLNSPHTQHFPVTSPPMKSSCLPLLT